MPSFLPSGVVDALEPRTLFSTLPAGFTQTIVAGGLAEPTCVAAAPDGRVFIGEDGGQIRVIDGGKLQTQPFATLAVDSTPERGVEGICLDPKFSTNHYIYVFYSTQGANQNARLGRFTASGDTAMPGSFVDLFDTQPIPPAATKIHNGGGLRFGADGKIYLSIGDEDNSANSQSLNNVFGKILRLNPDGSIPTDDPFYKTTSGINRAIWTLGLRNPFRMDVQPGSGKLFVNDVGDAAYEEVDDARSGDNFGWPGTEGPFLQSKYPNYTEPFFSYAHQPLGSHYSSITGGAFYNPAHSAFPSADYGKYFYADFVQGFVNVLDPTTGKSSPFATGFNSPVDLATAPDGSLYVVEFHNGGPNAPGDIVRVQYSPPIQVPPPVVNGNEGVAATSTTIRDGAFQNTVLTKRWQSIVNNTGIAGSDSRTAIQFNLGSISSTAHVMLNLFGYLASSSSPATLVSFYGTTGGLVSPANLTWNNTPLAGPSLGTFTVGTTWGQHYLLDISSWARTQLAAGQHTMTLLLEAPKVSTGVVAFTSDTGLFASERPQVTVSG